MSTELAISAVAALARPLGATPVHVRRADGSTADSHRAS
jgi:hypothetical protein